MTAEPVPGDPEVAVTHDGPVATIWLNRPAKRNAVTLAMWEELADFGARLGADPAVRLLVVRGVGDHFCAGADISSLGEGSAAGYRAANLAAEEALAAFAKPSIAFVRGSCVGGGAQIAMACDLRLADDTARFGVTPARLGIVYPGPSVARMVRLIGPAAAKHLLLSAELIGVDRALRVGLVDEVHEPRAAAERLAELASLLSTQRSLLTQMASKELVEGVGADGSIDGSIEDRWSEAMASSDDAVEGVVAFVERRPPSFTWTHEPGPPPPG